MLRLFSITVGALFSVLAANVAVADTELTGKWIGTFNSVRVDFPQQIGPLGAPSDEAKGNQSPRFLETTLQLDIETQKNGLAVGAWNVGDFKHKFVCAQFGQGVWECVNAGGRARLEVKSTTEIRVCYWGDREGAQGAGCGLLRKTP